MPHAAAPRPATPLLQRQSELHDAPGLVETRPGYSRQNNAALAMAILSRRDGGAEETGTGVRLAANITTRDPTKDGRATTI